MEWNPDFDANTKSKTIPIPTNRFSFHMGWLVVVTNGSSFYVPACNPKIAPKRIRKANTGILRPGSQAMSWLGRASLARVAVLAVVETIGCRFQF
jgi:hypothetical protein